MFTPIAAEVIFLNNLYVVIQTKVLDVEFTWVVVGKCLFDHPFKVFVAELLTG